MGQQLGNYAAETRRLINDRLSMFVTPTDMTAYINTARRQIAKLTHCLTVLVPGQCPQGIGAVPGSLVPGGGVPGANPSSTFNTIIGQEEYKYNYADGYVQAWNSGVSGVLDIVQVAVSWSGAMRPALDYMPWDDYQAYCRSYQSLMQSYPAVWSTLDRGRNSSVFLFPVPSVVAEMEWLVACVPKALYTDDDYDALPEPFDSVVKYYAAGLAYLGSQRPGQASLMFNMFTDHVGIDRASVDFGKSSSYYWGFP